MNVFDYMNLVSGYIINKFENKKDLDQSINFTIKPVRDPYTSELFYEVKENMNYSEQLFYLKFPCANKEEFYVAVKNLLVEYIKNSDLLMYSATSGEDAFNRTFSIVTKSRASIDFKLEDEEDVLVFNQFKRYLDIRLKNDTITTLFEKEDLEDLDEKMDEVSTLQKIRLN